MQKEETPSNTRTTPAYHQPMRIFEATSVYKDIGYLNLLVNSICGNNFKPKFTTVKLVNASIRNGAVPPKPRPVAQGRGLYFSAWTRVRFRPSRTASLTFARSHRSSGGSAITASWIAASIVSVLSSGLPPIPTIDRRSLSYRPSARSVSARQTSPLAPRAWPNSLAPRAWPDSRQIG